jgi:hypothetical protein
MTNTSTVLAYQRTHNSDLLTASYKQYCLPPLIGARLPALKAPPVLPFALLLMLVSSWGRKAGAGGRREMRRRRWRPTAEGSGPAWTGCVKGGE